MATQHADPGYGDPNAPVGSAEWAKRWRLSFQGAAKNLPRAPAEAHGYFEQGQVYRAWTLITNADDKPFGTFDEFCGYRQPWGLGMDPAKFRAYLVAEMGEKAADLATVSPDGRQDNGANQHTGPKEESGNGCPNPTGPSDRKEKNLRAILRADPLIQDLYRQDLVSQGAAVKMGPAKPDEDKAVKLVQARKAVEAIPKPTDMFDRKRYRKEVDETIENVMGQKKETPLDQVRKILRKLTPEEIAQLRQELEAMTTGPRSQ